MLFGETALRRAIAEYLQHYQTERPHQGLGNDRLEVVGPPGTGPVRCTARLGGLMKHDDRAA